MRAKFQCLNIVQYDGWQEANLNAVYGGSSNAEDNQFSQATPSGTLKISISNPKAKDFFKPGKAYYLDFKEVEEVK